MTNSWDQRGASLFCTTVLLLIPAFTPNAAGRPDRLAHGPTDRRKQKPLTILVSILPQKNLVQRVGGANVQVQVLVKAGQDPHSFKPTPKQILALAAVDAFFTLGLSFEARLIEKIRSGRPGLTVLAMDKNVQRRALQTLPDAESNAGEPDPHIWLSPELILIQLRNIYSGLTAIDPQKTDEYRRNLNTVLAELAGVDREISGGLRPFEGRSIFVFHPAFGYFTDYYGLHQVSVEVEGKRPSPKQLERLIQAARLASTKTIFVQRQFDSKSAEVLAESIGGAAVALDPMAADVIANLKDIAAAIITALR